MRSRPGRLHRGRCLVLGASLLVAVSTLAQTPEPPVSSLKNMSLEQLMDVEVTSVSRAPEKLLEAASAIEVITNEEIRRSGATTLPEALRLADNLDVAQKNSHDWGISARGFNTELANKLLVMIDGRTVYTPLFSGVIWDTQDVLLADVDRIEVISGPGGTLWGANAVNGVINIISRNARDTQGLYLETGGGDVLRDFIAARYGGKLAPDAYFRVYGKLFDRGHEVLPNGSSFSDSWNKRQGGFRVDAAPSQRDALTLQGDVDSGRDDLQTGGQDHTSGLNVLGRWVRTMSGDSGLELHVYYDRTHLQQPEPPLLIGGNPATPAGTFRDDLDTWDLDFQHRFHPAEKHHVVWGLGYRLTDDRVGNAPALGFFPTNLRRNLFSGFIQDAIALRSDLTLTIGTKIEHNDYTGFEVEPNIRMQWNRTKRQTIWAAVSRAVRTPSRIDRDLSEAVPPYFVILAGNPDFSSEDVLAYEAGWRAQLGARADAALSAFYNQYADLRSTAFNPVTVFPLQFENDLEGQTHGLELSGNLQAQSWWRLHLGYALLREHLHVRPGGTDINNALNETSDPEQRAQLRSSMDLPKRTTLDATLRWVDIRPSHNGSVPGSLPGYIELDARAGWQMTDRLELALVGQNLLHDHHPEYGFPTAIRAEIRRSLYATAVWRY